jgi:hypothetical protein
MMLYEIRVKGHLDQSWSAWFDGMTITNEANGDAIISGSPVDQAALLLTILRAMGPILPSTTSNCTGTF